MIKSANSGWTIPEQPLNEGVYCPICKRYYLPHQIEEHMLVHAELFKSSKYKDDARTDVSFRSDLVSYPFVEPLQFDTLQFNQPATFNLGKTILNMKHEQHNRKSGKIIQMIDCGTQTPPKPLLQMRSEQTDFFNCMDRGFNEGEFKYEQIVRQNVGIASKRHLNEFQQNRLTKWR